MDRSLTRNTCHRFPLRIFLFCYVFQFWFLFDFQILLRGTSLLLYKADALVVDRQGGSANKLLLRQLAPLKISGGRPCLGSRAGGRAKEMVDEQGESTIAGSRRERKADRARKYDLPREAVEHFVLNEWGSSELKLALLQPTEPK